MTKTTEAPTADELRERLVDYQQQEEGAAAELGRLELDGGPTTGSMKRLQLAREAVRRLERALVELERRQAAQAESKRQGAASAARHRMYAGVAESMSRAEAVLEARAALEGAEAHLRAHYDSGVVRALKSLRWDPERSDLDADVCDGAIVDLNWRTNRRPEPIRFHRRFTVERARDIRGPLSSAQVKRRSAKALTSPASSRPSCF